MSATDSLVNALADRYRIERELGAGGMATVYLAEDLKHHRRVAIKVLRPDLAAALGPERFQREIEIAAALRHAHILPLYDSGDAGGWLYYVMPFVEGETLGARLSRERQLPVDDALRLAREVADALAHAHAHGVVHRDIKPENILLEAGHAVVADFGIAKALAAAGDATALTATGMSVGTPAYMSPEQSAGDPGVDGRSDLYSLGCVLYEMLAGQPPFTGPTVESLVRQHITAPAPPVTQFRPAVPAAVAEALARALAKNPADRFNPVDQFASALDHRPAGADAAPTLQATRTIVSRRIVPWIAAALLVALVAAAWAGMRRGDGIDASIAVLPLRFADGDSSSSALALGVQGELITQLTRVPGLRVASRGAMTELAGGGRSERDMAQALGVATVLSGDIQRSGNQVRLTMALSDPGKGAELWAERYDRELTTNNLFAVQAEIARAVAEALRLRLAPAAAGDSVPPTQNVAALEFFYRAEATFEQRAGAEGDAEALDLAERAVSLDSTFARGWALVTRFRSWLVRTGEVTDTVPAYSAMLRTRALRPGSIEAQLAEGYYRYYCQADFHGALTALDAAARMQPESAELRYIRALLNRRLGQFEDARSLLDEMVANEPRNTLALATLGETLMMMRRYDEAEATLARAMEVAPTNSFVRTTRVMLALQVRGDTALARRLAVDAKPILGEWAQALTSLFLASYTRDLDAVLRVSPDALPGLTDPSNVGSRHLRLAVLERSLGHDAVARVYADSLRVHAASYAERFRAGADPFGSRILAEINLALADALQGKRSAALARTDAAARQLSRERDAVEHTSMLRWVAAVYALAGEREKAVAVLRDLLVFPGDLHLGELRLDPLWDDLRGMAEFEELAAE